MKILFASPAPYYPGCGNGGGEICFQFLKAVSTCHDVYFICFEPSPSELEKSYAYLTEVCKKVLFVKRERVSRWQVNKRRLAQFLGSNPIEAMFYESSKFRNEIIQVVSGENVDFFVPQFPYMAHYIDHDLPCKTVMDVQDLFFISRLREVFVQDNCIVKLRKFLCWIAWLIYERKFYAKADALMAISPMDFYGIKSILPSVNVIYAPIGFDFDFTGIGMPTGIKSYGFIGNFKHPPNLDGFEWLKDEIAPRVFELDSSIVFNIAGAGLDEALLRTMPRNMIYHGYVEDAKKFISTNNAMIAPLRFGGGVKVKVIESLGCGRPVITTPVGADGIDFNSGQGLYVVHDAEDFIRCVVDFSIRNDESAQVDFESLEKMYGLRTKVKIFNTLLKQLELA